MTEKNASFFYIRKDGSPAFIRAGIFESLYERKMAEFFPLFGSPVHDVEALTRLIKKYELDLLEIDSLDLSVRASNILREAGIETLDRVLMIHPSQRHEVKRLGNKVFRELQDTVEEILGIEVEKVF